MSIETIVSDIMIPTMLMNFYMNLKCLILPKKYPEQWDKRSIKMPVWFWNFCSVLGAVCALVIVYNLFTSLAMTDAVICVIIVVVLVVLSWIRLKHGAVKEEDLEALRRRTIQEALFEE